MHPPPDDEREDEDWLEEVAKLFRHWKRYKGGLECPGCLEDMDVEERASQMTFFGPAPAMAKVSCKACGREAFLMVGGLDAKIEQWWRSLTTQEKVEWIKDGFLKATKPLQ